MFKTVQKVFRILIVHMLKQVLGLELINRIFFFNLHECPGGHVHIVRDAGRCYVVRDCHTLQDVCHPWFLPRKCQSSLWTAPPLPTLVIVTTNNDSIPSEGRVQPTLRNTTLGPRSPPLWSQGGSLGVRSGPKGWSLCSSLGLGWNGRLEITDKLPSLCFSTLTFKF